jgi:hypothetical protein
MRFRDLNAELSNEHEKHIWEIGITQWLSIIDSTRVISTCLLAVCRDLPGSTAQFHVSDVLLNERVYRASRYLQRVAAREFYNFGYIWYWAETCMENLALLFTC